MYKLTEVLKYECKHCRSVWNVKPVLLAQVILSL